MMDNESPGSNDATEAYLRLLAQHERWLAGYVYSLVPQGSDGDDILQEVKVTMWRNFGKFEPGSVLAKTKFTSSGSTEPSRRGWKRQPFGVRRSDRRNGCTYR